MPAEPDERERAFIDAGRVAHLATVSESGEPQVVPVCYSYDGERLFVVIDEKPKRRDRKLKRVRNIEETGRVSLVIDRYDDRDWSRLAWVMIRGTAVMLGPEDPAHGAIVERLRQRYDQYREMALEGAPVIAITPERVTSWGALDN